VPQFNPNNAIRFNLPEGSLSTREGTKVVLVSAETLGEFIATAGPKGGAGLLRTIGDTLGREALASLSKPFIEATLPEIVDHLAGWLRVGGWGRLSFERWGDALVADFVSTTVNARAAERLLEGMLARLSDRSVACAYVEGSRFLLLSADTAAEVRGWSRSGMRLGEIVSRLGAAE
jgi:hypothetical protein